MKPIFLSKQIFFFHLYNYIHGPWPQGPNVPFVTKFLMSPYWNEIHGKQTKHHNNIKEIAIMI